MTEPAGRVHGVPGMPLADALPGAELYHVEEVTFWTRDIRLAGTLTWPTGDGPYPAVVMLTGTGAQNRDENLFGFPIFAVIADHLTRHGIAVLRFDDRGVGSSTGTAGAATLADRADDALSAAALLAGRQAIDPSRIGVLGHSIGGIVGAAASADSSTVSFLILMAVPAIRGEELLARQQADGARALGATPLQVAAAQAAFRRLVAAIRTMASTDVIHAAARDLVTAQYEARSHDAQVMLGDKEAFIAQALPAAITQLEAAATRDLIDLDPPSILGRVRCPVLALFGGKDTQVPLDANRPALEASFAAPESPTATIRVYPDANHLFMPADTGDASEYQTLPRTFVPGLLDDVTGWVRRWTSA